jgi:PKD repeat protein
MTNDDTTDDREGSLELTRRQAVSTLCGAALALSGSASAAAATDATATTTTTGATLASGSTADLRRELAWKSIQESSFSWGGDEEFYARSRTSGTLDYLGADWEPDGNPLASKREEGEETESSGCWKHTFLLVSKGYTFNRAQNGTGDGSGITWELNEGASVSNKLRVLSLDENEPLEQGDLGDDAVVRDPVCGVNGTTETVTADPVSVSARRDPDLYGFLNPDALLDAYTGVPNSDVLLDELAAEPGVGQPLNVTQLKREVAQQEDNAEDLMIVTETALGLAGIAFPPLGLAMAAYSLAKFGLNQLDDEFERDLDDPPVPDDRGFQNQVPEDASDAMGPIGGVYAMFDVRVAPDSVGQVRVETDHVQIGNAGQFQNPGWTLQFDAPPAPTTADDLTPETAYHADVAAASGMDSEEADSLTFRDAPTPVITPQTDVTGDADPVEWDAYDTMQAQAPVERYDWQLWRREETDRGFDAWMEVKSRDDTVDFSYDFTQEGEYMLELTAVDACENRATVSDIFTIGEANAPPTVSIFEPGDETLEPGATVPLEGYAVDESANLDYRWQLIDVQDEPPEGVRRPGQRIEQIATGKKTTYNFKRGGEFDLRVWAEDPQGATAFAEQRITVDDPGNTPAPSFTVEPPAGDEDGELDPGEDLQFTASADTSNTERTVSEYEWRFGDGATAGPIEATSVTHAYDDAGIYEVELTITDDIGRTASATETIVVGEPSDPTAVIEVLTDDPQPGGAVEFSGAGSSMPDGEIVDYEWDLDDDGTFGDATETATVSKTWHEEDEGGPGAGEYTVTLRVYGRYADADADRVSDTTETTVTVGNPTGPTADLSVTGAVSNVDSGYEVESGAEIIFSGAPSSDPNGEVQSYNWTFPSGAVSDETVTKTFGETRSFDLELTVTDLEDLTDSVTTTVTVVDENQAPNPDFDVTSKTPRAEEPVTFDAGATTDPDGNIDRYEWTFGDDGTATGEVVPHTYDDDGQYNVEMAAIDTVGERATISDQVTIGDPTEPTPSIELSYEVGAGDTTRVTFDGTGSSMPDGEIVDYEWDLDGSDLGSTAMEEQSFESAGNHDVTLTVTGRPDSGGDERSNSASRAFTVNQAPDAEFTFSPDPPTVGEDYVRFDASSSNDDGSIESYDWDFDDGGTDTEQVAFNRFDSDGVYDVELTVTDDFDESTTVSKTVETNAKPTARIDASDTDPDANESITLDGSGSSDPEGSIENYDWSWSGGSASRESFTESFDSDTEVTLTVTDTNGGTDNTSVTIEPNQLPTAEVSVSPSTPEIGDTITFSGENSSDPDGSINSYDWSGDVSGGGEEASVSADQPDEYTAKLTVTDDDGAESGTASKTVTVETEGLNADIDVQGLSPPYRVFEGVEVNFDAAGSSGYIEDYLWEFPDGSSQGGSEASFTFDQSDSGDVTLTISNGLPGSNPSKASVSITVQSSGGYPEVIRL